MSTPIKVKKFPRKTVKISHDSYVVIQHGDLKFSISVRNLISDSGIPLKYVMIHHDTNFKEVTFSDSLGAKIATTNKDGSIYDVSINEERV